MPTLDKLWLGVHTRNIRYAGTDSRIVVIVNEDGIDVAYAVIGDTSQTDLEQGHSNIYTLSGQSVTSENVGNSSVRIGILGSDLWGPGLIFLWGRDAANKSEVYPLAIETSISGGLSNDASEGRSSVPLRAVDRGSDDMPINRILVLLATSNIEDSGTKSVVQLGFENDGEGSPVYWIAGSKGSPAKLSRGEAEIFTLPVSTPFVRRTLKAVSLRIRGDDMWLPQSLFVFGLDDASGRPEAVVSLVNEDIFPPELSRLSTDANEGTVGIDFQLLH
jgi:hypothetical protein